jgi:membrane protein DedA with SNARE-associated domain
VEYLHSLTGLEAYALICFLVFVEEAGVPLPFLPGDVILLAAGYLAAIGVASLWLFLPVLYLSAVAGALLCYTFSRHVGRPLVLRVAGLLRLSPARLMAAERWMLRAGGRGIALARVLPGTRINASFAAGGLRLPLRSFVPGVLASTPAWLLTFLLLGYSLGDRVTPLLPWFDKVVLALLACGAVAGAVLWRRRSTRRPAAVRLAA